MKEKVILLLWVKPPEIGTTSYKGGILGLYSLVIKVCIKKGFGCDIELSRLGVHTQDLSGPLPAELLLPS